LSVANTLDEGTSLLENILIFNDDVITGRLVRYYELYALLIRSVSAVRLESSRGRFDWVNIPPKIRRSVPPCHKFGIALHEMGMHGDYTCGRNDLHILSVYNPDHLRYWSITPDKRGI
jgi:hypothetical protein